MATPERFNDLTRPADLARLNQFVEELYQEVEALKHNIGITARLQQQLTALEIRVTALENP